MFQKRTSDLETEVWPPPPDRGYQPPLPSPPRAGFPAWLGAFLAAALGAILGAGTLLAVLFTAFFVMDDAGGPMFVVLAVAAALFVGGFLGMVLGLGIWFFRRAQKHGR